MGAAATAAHRIPGPNNPGKREIDRQRQREREVGSVACCRMFEQELSGSLYCIIFVLQKPLVSVKTPFQTLSVYKAAEKKNKMFNGRNF